MQLKKETTGEQAFQRLAALCARGEHCRHELSEKMRRWGVSDADQEQVLARLTEGRYVDDERYARAFVHDKVCYDRWGRRKVEQALWQKHIDADVARDVLDTVTPDEWADALRPLLEQKRRSLRAYEGYELRTRLLRYALQRGFDMATIRRCMEVEGDDTEMDDDVADAY